MFYSSIIKHTSVQNNIKKDIIKISRHLGDNLQVALGTIAKGIIGNEPTLSPKDLDKDLAYFKKQGIETAAIFRLGGLNEEYMRVIKRHL